LAFVAAPAGADEGRGECRYLPGPTPDRIELIDLSTSADRISMRRNGDWVRTIDGTQTTFSVNLADQEGSWIARVFPKDDGDRYDLTCTVADVPSNRTSCTVAFGDDAQLRFPGIDARRIVVRANDRWQATLPGDADRWTDPSPSPDADYFIRVRETDGGSTDVPCTPLLTNREFGGVGEVTNGGFLPVGVVPGPSSDQIDERDLTAATGLDGQYSTDTSGDGSAVLAGERGLFTQKRTFRVHLASESADEIDRAVPAAVGFDQVAISFDGDTVAYVRPGGNLRVRTYDGADLLSDRWVLKDPDLSTISLSGSGDFVIIERELAGGVELVRVDLETRAATTIHEAAAVTSFAISSDANRLLVVEDRFDPHVTIVDVSTGERTRYELSPEYALRFGRIRSALSGDGSTLVLGVWCLGEPCPVEIIDLDAGTRRVFVGVEAVLSAVNHDGTRILLTEDEGEDWAILEIDSRDLTFNPAFSQHLLFNGNSTDDEFTIIAGESRGLNANGFYVNGIGIAD
jgi:uncharacterized lipoprotein YmbA